MFDNLILNFGIGIKTPNFNKILISLDYIVNVLLNLIPKLGI